MWKMSFCDSDQKSMPIVGFLTCNGSSIFCGPKLVPIGGLDTELISRLQCEARSYPYLQVIGSVMYAMLGTRPDIAYAVSTLSRFASRPGTPHVRALKHLLRYLKGSANYGITYSRDGGSLMGCEITLNNDIIHGFTDSDYAMDPDSRRSVSGAICLLAGGPISWRSKLQSSVSQSSTEAEYVASTEAAKEAI